MEFIKNYTGEFTKESIRPIQNEINKLWNDYSSEPELSTILVVLTMKNKTIKKVWVDIPKSNLDKIQKISLYKVIQKSVLLDL
jgi:hypothetical protein